MLTGTTRTWAATLAGALLVVASAIGASAQTLPQVKLADDLDRPGEGYCLDILGVGPTARADLPLVAHNCLPELDRVDRHAVIQNGRIAFPAFDACVTAFGVVSPLPGSPVLLRDCDASESFLPADALQRFERTGSGQLELAGSNLCLTVGADAARTFSARDRWRTLTMEPCDSVPLSLSVWE